MYFFTSDIIFALMAAAAWSEVEAWSIQYSIRSRLCTSGSVVVFDGDYRDK